MTKTEEAMQLVDQGIPAYRAAKEKGISSNTLYVALAKRRKRRVEETLISSGICPCCRQRLPSEKPIDT